MTVSEEGANECPPGSTAISKAECLAAAQEALRNEGRVAHNRILQEGAWSHTPPGCFVFIKSHRDAVTHPTTPSRIPQFSTGTGTNDGSYQLVCKKNSE